MKIIVVGAGSIGSRHIKNLLTLGYRDISVVDKNKQSLKNFSKTLQCYSSLPVALEKQRSNVAFICTPTSLHIQQAKTVLEFGCDVFIEKPISNSVAELFDLKKKSGNKVVMVGCNWRFNKAFVEFERILNKGVFGKVLYARIACGYFLPTARPEINYKNIYASFEMGGGVLLDSGSHIVNYLLALFGEVSRTVYLTNSVNYLKIESNEIAHLILKHKNGITCDISMDYVSKKQTNRIEVITDSGLLTMDLTSGILSFDNGIRNKVVFKKEIDPNEMFILELKHFFNCVEKRSKPLQDIDEALKVMKVLIGGTKN